MHYERMSLENEGNCWGAVTTRRLYCAVTAFNRCSRTVVRAICTLRKHAQLCACFRAQDTTQGDTGVVEPGARAAGAKGIERCPPHVYL